MRNRISNELKDGCYNGIDKLRSCQLRRSARRPINIIFYRNDDQEWPVKVYASPNAQMLLYNH